MSPQRAQVEEVINETSGKVYLPPCQIACPLGENIQRTLLYSPIHVSADPWEQQYIKFVFLG